MIEGGGKMGVVFEPGMVPTVEPGLDFRAHVETVPAELRGIGAASGSGQLASSAGPLSTSVRGGPTRPARYYLDSGSWSVPSSRRTRPQGLSSRSASGNRASGRSW